MPDPTAPNRQRHAPYLGAAGPEAGAPIPSNASPGFDSKRWGQVEELFHLAAEQPVAEREAFLARECTDEGIRAEVRSLLNQKNVRAGFLDDDPAAALPLLSDLLPGQRLGAYEIRGLLGAGGMGEVYEAFDIRLQRNVAIKVLPPAVANDDRVARFEREARVLASLNHSHVGAIYGFEEVTTAAGRHIRALVLELVAGETLADRIDRGALPIAAATALAIQITEALEVAHEKGIVHRDLKPANIKITPEGAIKVLDFGLAAIRLATASIDGTETRSRPADGTLPGVILGTAPYMSPEQARGETVDRRTDIWAFGCVLFEMITGTRAFAGGTISDVVAGILEREPDWALLPAQTTGALHRVLRWSLTKDPRRRLRDIVDARLELETAEAVSPSATTRRSPRRLWMVAWVAAVIVSAGVGAGISRAVRSAPSDATTVSSQFAIPVGVTEVLPRNVAISPDGRFVAYLAGPRGNQKTYLRRIGEVESRVIAQLPMQAPPPFFSSDSQWLAFFDAGKLKKMAVEGGSSIILAEAPTPRGGTWGMDGSIVFAPISRGGLMWIPPEGGPPRVLTTLDGGRGETSHRFPAFVPQSSTVLFVVEATSDSDRSLQAVSLGDRRVTLIMHGAVTNPRYVRTGHLAYVNNEKLVAAPFDLRTLQRTASPITLVERVNSFSFSDEGTLVYSESILGNIRVSTPVWTARDGAVTPLPLPPAIYDHPRISPDGRSIVLYKELAGDRHLWKYDTTRETLTKVTLTFANDWPVWTPDGKRLIYASNRPDTQWDIVEKPADGSGPERMLLTRPSTQIPRAVSPSGDTLVFEETYADRANTLWQMSLGGTGEPHTLFDRAGEMMPTFSPDGRWIAYVSPQSARNEVYVRSSTGEGSTWQVSNDGGVEPVWSASGRELFYRADDKMMVVDVLESTPIAFAKPRLLFEGTFVFGDTEGQVFDVARDGRRFLMLKPQISPAAAPLPVVVNWFAEVRRLMAVSQR